MKKYITSSILTIAATYFAVFTVSMARNAEQITEQICGVMLECPETSYVSALLFAGLSAVLFVSAIVSVIKAK